VKSDEEKKSIVNCDYIIQAQEKGALVWAQEGKKIKPQKAAIFKKAKLSPSQYRIAVLIMEQGQKG